MNWFRNALLAGIACALLAGCNVVQKPQRGGGASISKPTPSGTLATTTIQQPDNPSAASKQEVVEHETETYVFPVETTRTTETKTTEGTVITVVEKIPAGTKKVVESKKDTKQEIGPAQKDTSREITAKLASFRPVQFVGIALLLAAGAMLHPLVRTAIGGGKEIQMAAAGIGVALIFGPSIFVGNEKILLISGLAALLIAYGLSRLGYYKGKHDASEK